MFTALPMSRFTPTSRFGFLEVHRGGVLTLLDGVTHGVLGYGVPMLINVLGGR